MLGVSRLSYTRGVYRCLLVLSKHHCYVVYYNICMQNNNVSYRKQIASALVHVKRYTRTRIRNGVANF